MDAPHPTDEAKLETQDEALARAIAESDADPRTVPHDLVRTWLLGIANGDFETPTPEPQ